MLFVCSSTFLPISLVDVLSPSVEIAYVFSCLRLLVSTPRSIGLVSSFRCLTRCFVMSLHLYFPCFRHLLFDMLRALCRQIRLFSIQPLVLTCCLFVFVGSLAAYLVCWRGCASFALFPLPSTT